MGHSPDIREGMAIISADGAPVGVVDKVKHHRIKLTKTHAPGSHGDHHHYLPLGLVAGIEGDVVRLSVASENVAGFIEEKHED